MVKNGGLTVKNCDFVGNDSDLTIKNYDFKRTS